MTKALTRKAGATKGHSIEAHPLRRLFDAGIQVTLNTDDPTFFNTTLTDEYRLAAHVFGFDAAEL